MSKGKIYAISASCFSLLFSFIGIMIAKNIGTLLKSETHQLTFIDIMIENNNTEAQAQELLTLFRSFTNGFIITSYIYVIIGLVVFVVAFRIKDENKYTLGKIMTMSAFIHLIGFRFLAFALFLIAGIKLKKEL